MGKKKKVADYSGLIFLFVVVGLLIYWTVLIDRYNHKKLEYQSKTEQVIEKKDE